MAWKSKPLSATEPPKSPRARIPHDVPVVGDRVRLRVGGEARGKLLSIAKGFAWATVKWDEGGEAPSRSVNLHLFELEKDHLKCLR